MIELYGSIPTAFVKFYIGQDLGGLCLAFRDGAMIPFSNYLEF